VSQAFAFFFAQMKEEEVVPLDVPHYLLFKGEAI